MRASRMANSIVKSATVSITDAVSAIILRNYVVYESLKLKIVNYHALAAKIAGEVEDMTGREANIETIVVAIKRFSDRLPVGKMEEMPAILKDAKLSLAGGVVDVTIRTKGTPTLQILQDVLKLSPKFVGVPNIFQLLNSVKVIAEEEDVRLLDRALSARYSLSFIRNVAKIIIRVPPASQKVPGIASFITELLYRNGVSLIDAFLGYEDIVLIVQEKFVPKAYQALSEEISEKS